MQNQLPTTPDYLYHYTNIETLALILSNRTIRFNSLDKMDDLQEQKTADAKNIGKCVYISSWTDDEQESIPMWNMYSSLKSGVRIKMRSCPFELRTVDFNAMAEAFPKNKISIEGIPAPSLIPYHEMMTKGCCIFPNTMDGLLQKVEYVNDEEKLCPSVVRTTTEHTEIAFNLLGRYKNLHWSFQNEWRYIFRAFPVDYHADVERMLKNVILNAQNVIDGSFTQVFPYYDMPIEDTAYGEMEITMSPQISAGNRIILKNLIEKYNPTATIRESSLLGLI